MAAGVYQTPSLRSKKIVTNVIHTALEGEASYLSNGRLQEGQLTPVAVVDIRSLTKTDK